MFAKLVQSMIFTGVSRVFVFGIHVLMPLLSLLSPYLVSCESRHFIKAIMGVFGRFVRNYGS